MSGLLQFLIVLTLAAHLICMNVCSAGPLLTVWLERRYRRTLDPAANQLGIQLTKTVVWTFFIGIGFGFLLAGLIWLSGKRDFFDALPAFSHKIWWGVWELLTYLAAVIGYLYLWPRDRTSAARAYFHRFLAIFAATNLLYHFPPLFTAMANFENATPDAAVTPAQFRQIIFSHDVMSISAHFLMASIAVSGATVMLLGRRSALGESKVTWPVIAGARIALVATAFQFMIGMWVVLKLEPDSQQMVMGGSAIATGCLLLSVGLSFDLLNRLSSIAFGQVTDKGIRFAVGHMTTIVLLMSATLWLAQH